MAEAPGRSHLTPRWAYFRPETFKIDMIRGGARLHVTCGIHRPWISTADLVAMAHGIASIRGGRLEIDGSPLFRAIAKSLLRGAGAVRVDNREHKDVYLTARPGRGHALDRGRERRGRSADPRGQYLAQRLQSG